MAHMFETGFFGGNVPAWHNLGTVIEAKGLDSKKALTTAGLDWQVVKEPLMHRGLSIDGKFVTVRVREMEDVDPDGEAQVETLYSPLGVVGSKYQPIQNHEAFEIGDAIIEETGSHWHTAGSLAGGRRVWMLMDLGPYDLLKDEDEVLQQYLLVSNSHDGSSAMQVMFTDVRVVCQNTLSYATATTPRKVSIRHTGDPTTQLAMARKVLGLQRARTVELAQDAQYLLELPFSGKDFTRMLEVIVPVDEDASDRAKTMAQNKREQLFMGYKLSDNIDNVRHTGWGALQSVIETNEHALLRKGNEERRFQQSMEGSDLVDRTHEYLSAL